MAAAVWRTVADRLRRCAERADRRRSANPHLFGHERRGGDLRSRAWPRGRLPHAWLLRGPRGVGKATLAYRFARRLLAGADHAARRGRSGPSGLPDGGEPGASRPAGARARAQPEDRQAVSATSWSIRSATPTMPCTRPRRAAAARCWWSIRPTSSTRPAPTRSSSCWRSRRRARCMLLVCQRPGAAAAHDPLALHAAARWRRCRRPSCSPRWRGWRPSFRPSAERCPGRARATARRAARSSWRPAAGSTAMPTLLPKLVEARASIAARLDLASELVPRAADGRGFRAAPTCSARRPPRRRLQAGRAPGARAVRRRGSPAGRRSPPASGLISGWPCGTSSPPLAGQVDAAQSRPRCRRSCRSCRRSAARRPEPELSLA